MGIGLQVSDDEADSEEETQEADNANTKYSEKELDELRKEVEASIENDERTAVPEIITKTVKLTITDKEVTKAPEKEQHNEDDDVPTLVKQTTEEEDNIGDLDKNSQKYRLAMIEKALSDVRSMRTYTSASTIAPEVVKQQVKKNLEVRQKKMERKKAIAKGEASAVTRQRRDNRETIRESHGIWGWDE